MAGGDPGEHSHGFRPGRRAHDAVKAARAYVQSGKRVVVDVDLAKFFDRVNHDILIERLKRRIDDAAVLRLIRAYLNAGIMDGGVVIERDQGTPQGGPLSPLLANVLLDDVDKALEARGYSFARYADDCNVYVGSVKAGERVLGWLRMLYGELKLQINEAKSAVCSAVGRKFLGYALWVAKGREVKCAVAHKALGNFKARIRQLTRRSGGCSMVQVVERLRPYLLGWKAYFALAQTPKVWRGLDEWLRHRLRAIQLKHWKRSSAIYRELKVLGAADGVANNYLNSLAPPFFKALVHYANDGSYSWHCPGHSGGVAFLKSPVGQMFHQFFGENMLRADVCNAVDELGQLLDHTGPVAASERNAARIFTADHLFFVTNGTSTSNKIVWHSAVGTDDVVLVDRNCHKSILHAIMMTGTVPIFLQPTRNHQGIIGPIPIEEFDVASIQRKIDANPLVKDKSVRPRVMTITQSTYDGVIYNVEKIKAQLGDYIENLHFDEAWLPHAVFHPYYHSPSRISQEK